MSRTTSDTCAGPPAAASDPTVDRGSGERRNGLGRGGCASVTAVETDVVMLMGPFMNVAPREVRTCTQYQYRVAGTASRSRKSSVEPANDKGPPPIAVRLAKSSVVERNTIAVAPGSGSRSWTRSRTPSGASSALTRAASTAVVERSGIHSVVATSPPSTRGAGMGAWSVTYVVPAALPGESFTNIENAVIRPVRFTNPPSVTLRNHGVPGFGGSQPAVRSPCRMPTDQKCSIVPTAEDPVFAGIADGRITCALSCATSPGPRNSALAPPSVPIE